LEFLDRSSHQFWRVEVEGENRTITTGKVGAKTAPKPKLKAFKSAADAAKDALKEIAKKKADYWFDPSSLAGILASHAEFLTIPTEVEVQAHKEEVRYAPDSYFDVFRSGAFSIGDF